MNNCLCLPDNIPIGGVLILLHKTKNDNDRQLMEEVISKMDGKLLQIWWHYSDGKSVRRVSAYTFIKKCFLNPLQSLIVNNNTFLISIPMYCSYPFSENPNGHTSYNRMRGIEFYRITRDLISQFHQHQIISATIIEIPSDNFIRDFTGTKFSERVDEITDFGKVEESIGEAKTLLETMELYLEVLYDKLNLIKQAHSRLREWATQNLLEE